MERQYGIVTFDCYGTLIDWESGITSAFQAAARRDGHALDRDAIIAAHAEVEPAVQSAGYRSYHDVLALTAQRMAERFDWKLDAERTTFLPRSVPDWKPFNDTDPALRRLQDRGYRLGILSNVDDDLLAGTLRHFTVSFDLLVTAQQVRAYKPAKPHFLTARERIGDRRWLHAAQSWFHDVEPASALGIPVAWVNRKGERPGGDRRPDHEAASMRDLADWLAPLAV